MSKANRKHRRHGVAPGARPSESRVPRPSAAPTDPYAEMQAASRLYLRRLWESAQAGAALEGEAARTVQAMRDHPEYAALWPRLDELSAAELEQGGVNPIMHIITHTTVENQLAENNPPVIGEVLAALLAQGLSRHEALHQISSVFTEELFTSLRARRLFDGAGYERKLRRLLRG